MKIFLPNSFLLLLSLSVCPLANSQLLAPDIEQTVGDGAKAVVNTGSGNVVIGITLKEHEASLKRREAELKAQLKKAHSKDRRVLELELKATKQRLQDSKQSYQEHISDLRKRITQLETIRGQVPDDFLDQAQSALARGDTQQADALFKQVEDQAQGPIKAAAEAAYQRCQIALDEIRYQTAFSRCQRSVQLAPENTLYLSGAAELAYILGQYHLARTYYQQGLASDLKTFGEDHPDVATDRNNLGATWHALGEYQKALSYFEQALISDLKTFGEDHPRVANLRNNLGEAWQSLGEYQKALSYFEQALISHLKTLGEDHPAVAEDCNHLGGSGTRWASIERRLGIMSRR